ncbi:MAG: tetratricopeptide repeat protein [Nitrospiraceae bacterium]|nr:tetratricopeptide repeat protein [Nitrospiraceae bacterium]
MKNKRLLLVLVSMILFSCATGGQKREANLHYKLGLAQLRGGQYQSAYVEFQKSLEFYDGDKDVYNALGYIYLRWDDPESAEKAFMKAVNIDGDFSEGYNNLCLVEYKKRDYGKAIDFCEKALSNPLYPTPEKAFFNLGMTYFKLKKYSDSIEAFTQAVTRKADYYPAHYELAALYNMTGEYGSAAKSLERAVACDPRFKGNLEKAENFFQTGGTFAWSNDAPQIMEVFKY